MSPVATKSIAAAPPTVPGPVAAPAAAAAARRSDALLPRRGAVRLAAAWLSTAGWQVSRTGRSGLTGLALLIAAGIFYASTHLQVVAEIATLREELAAARRQAVAERARPSVDPAAALRQLPRRVEMPALLGLLLQQADAAHLSLDTGKYDLTTSRSGDVVRYKLSFPVSGPYPQVRRFLDATLEALPAAAISELSFERKTIGDANVAANIRLTVFTRGGS